MLNTLVYTSQGKSFERFAFEIINKCKNSAKKAVSRVALGVKHTCVHNPQGGGGGGLSLICLTIKVSPGDTNDQDT